MNYLLAAHITTMSDLWDAPQRLFPSRFPLGAHIKHSCKHNEATSAYQGLADIASCGQRLEVAAVVNQLNLWDLDGLQLLLSLTVYDVQLLHTVQQHRCPWVDPLQKHQIPHLSNASSIRAKETNSGQIPERPTGNSGTASSLVTTRGHFITAHMHKFKGRDNEGPSTEKLYGILTEKCCTHMAIHQSSCPLGTQFMLQHTFYPEVSKPRQLHHCSQVVTTLCWFSRVPSIRTFSVSYHQTNTAKSTELRATEIHLQENYWKKKKN